MPDEIEIVGLRCRTRIGFRPHELDGEQEVVLTIRFTVDLSRAAKSDDVADGVDYREVTKAVLAHVEGGDFMLLERLAAEVADVVLSFDGTGSCTVRAEKPGALRFARSVAVTVTRDRVAGKAAPLPRTRPPAADPV